MINGDSIEIRQFILTRVYIALLKGFPWNLVSAQGSEETTMMGLTDDRKSFKIGLAILIQYWRVTDIQPASTVAVASTIPHILLILFIVWFPVHQNDTKF